VLLTVNYILKDADGNQIGAELQYNGKTVQSKPLKEKVLGSIGSTSFNHGKSRSTRVSVKLR